MVQGVVDAHTEYLDESERRRTEIRALVDANGSVVAAVLAITLKSPKTIM
jgi:hypothetical protein